VPTSPAALIAEACVVADGRPYVVALIVPDREAEFAGDITQAIAEGVEKANSPPVACEQIKRFRILEDQWPAGSDLVTPTMKLKRRAIVARYAAEIEALYQDR
jgi:long-subunit acyl-CoA synthetase (AMP-forming)